MTEREALKLALEALEEAWYHVGTFQPTEKAIDLYDEARTAIKEALAQPEQEPVAWIDFQKEAQQIVESKVLWKRFIDGTPLANDIACWMADFAQYHTTPPQRKPLTDEMREQMRFLGFDTLESRTPFVAGWLKAEAAHGIKGKA